MQKLNVLFGKIKYCFKTCCQFVVRPESSLKILYHLQISSAILLWFLVISIDHEKNQLWFVSPALFIAGLLAAVLFVFLMLGLRYLINLIPARYFGSALLLLVISILAALNISDYWMVYICVALFASLPPLFIAYGIVYLKQTEHKKAYNFMGWSTIGLGSAILILGLVWLSTPGFQRKNRLQLPSGLCEAGTSLPEDPSSTGSYPVLTLSYGSGVDLHRPEYGEQADIKTQAVDASSFLPEMNNGSAFFYQQYWGFTYAALPLNGKVWYPQGSGPFPLVLIVHGNHTAEDYSEDGYAYLGELLASRGLIVASVDENFLNGSWISMLDSNIASSENDARAWLLLQHLQLWRTWNGDVQNPFHEMVNMQQIALIGHSRGGEAITEAAAFNALGRYPDNGSITFPAPFQIRALVAIAPVDTQYNPAGKDTPLHDVDYLVIHGSADADVSSFNGLAAYNRLTFSAADSFHFKSAIYVHQANHGQFNSTWGNSDKGRFGGFFLDRRNLLAQQDQEKIAQLLISAFLETSLSQNHAFLPLFQNPCSAKDWLPDATIWAQYNDSDESLLATFEEDLDLQSISAPSGKINADGFTLWREALLTGKWNNGLNSSAVNLTWEENNSPASYDLSFIDELTIHSDQTLIFSVAADESNKEEQEPNSLVDFSIELSDGQEKAALPLHAYLQLIPNPQVSVMKNAFLQPDIPAERFLQSVRIPLEDFLKQNPSLTPDHIQRVRFIFDQSISGNIWLDNIGYR
jgi:dienelactone hydrolase